jgi:cysteinyl-tRNA synthetase
MLKVYNTLSKKEEEFKPISEGKVGMYSCGPTVYNYAHIGNLRSYIFVDVLKRTLQYEGLAVKHVMNITDVGHLVSDSDDGDDKMTKALKREGLPMTLEAMKTIALKYEEAFVEDLKKLNILLPDVMPRATDHIAEDIEIIKKLEEKGFVYKTSDGLYFDTSKDLNYGALGGLSDENVARVEANSEKKNPRDFALWKFNSEMGWETPWGKGFPGWHIECSGMSMKYLGEHFDIHTGGIDHIPIHHNNEIAQSENATGQKYVNYWLHNNFLNVDNEKISKSLGNDVYLKTLEEKGFSPADYRYFLLQTNYRSLANFTWEGLEAAQNALKKLKNAYLGLGTDTGTVSAFYKQQFTEGLEDNLNTPKALAVVWELVNDKEALLADKHATLLEFDKVLGLGMDTWMKDEIPTDVLELAQERNKARLSKEWAKSDELRDKIKALGYEIKDLGEEFEVRKI